MEILYIDPESANGHINFNNIYLKELESHFGGVDIIVREGYINKLNYIKSQLIFHIPNKFYRTRFANRLQYRFNFIKRLLYIRRNIKKYDIIIFSTYDIIANIIVPFKGRVILINHNNLRTLKGFIRKHLIKNLAKSNTHLVFNNFIKEGLNRIGVNNVVVSPHGLTDPFNINVLQTGNRHFDDKLREKRFRYVIFSASKSSTCSEILSNMLESRIFLKSLEDNRVLFVYRSDYKENDHSNTFQISGHLSDVEYKSIFLRCHAVTLFYPKSFGYRSSGVFFEAVSNNKPLFLSDIDAFKTYLNNFCYNPIIRDFRSLPNVVVDRLQSINKHSYYKNIELLKPNLRSIISK